MYKFIKNIFVNPRKRVNKLYDIREKANKELDEIRKDCPHKKWHTGNYSYRVGSFQFGGLCDVCDKFLGEAKTLKDWWSNFETSWRTYVEYELKNNELLEEKAELNFQDPFRQRFYLQRELDVELPKIIKTIPSEMETYLSKWIKPR